MWQMAADVANDAYVLFLDAESESRGNKKIKFVEGPKPKNEKTTNPRKKIQKILHLLPSISSSSLTPPSSTFIKIHKNKNKKKSKNNNFQQHHHHLITTPRSTTTSNIIIKIIQKVNIHKIIQEALFNPTPNFTPFLLPHRQTP